MFMYVYNTIVDYAFLHPVVKSRRQVYPNVERLYWMKYAVTCRQ